MKRLITGNEAVALGALEAGVEFATGYPGTPATEIIESLSGKEGPYVEWSSNEKTALEMASGVSFSGRRSLVVMKHVGLNVALDPLMTLAYTGVRGGLVIAVSDDPGMQSSQNEQDSRLIASMAKIPLLEPSDSQEALSFTKEAFRISERFDIPVIVRLTQAVSHSESLVKMISKINTHSHTIKREPEKYVMLPPFCNRRRLDLEKRLLRLKRFSERFRFNKIETLSKKTGIITSGISYQYVKDAVPEASVLKLSLTYPLPSALIKRFSRSVKRLFVVEELEPFIEDSVRAEGIDVIGKRDGLPTYGELSVPIIRDFIRHRRVDSKSPIYGNGSFCTGCPYIGVFYVLKGLGVYVFGDIGCYTLGARVFPGSIDTTLCMGAGISQAAGFSKLNPDLKVVALIGDSTFYHSGLSAVVNARHHGSNLTIILFENSVTAMTGGQPHAGGRLDTKNVLTALGVEKIIELNPYDIKNIENSLREAISLDTLSAVIVRGRCVVKKEPSPLSIDRELCNLCLRCLALRCPSIKEEGGIPSIGRRCIGCMLCASVCPTGAIR